MLIDLDVGPDRPSPVKTRRPNRYAGLVLAAVLLVLLGGAAGEKRDPGLVPVLADDAQGVLASLLTADTLYTLRGGDPTTIDAQPLTPAGWSFSAPTPAGRQLTLAGETLIVDGGDAGLTTFVDARSGEVRWQLGDFGFAQVHGTKVTDWRPERRTVRTWDLATGDQLWTGTASEFTADEAYVVALDERGAVSVYATASGRLVAAVRDLDVPRGPTGTTPAVMLVEGRLIAYGQDYVAAFRPDGLTRLWITRTGTPFALGGCGDGRPGLICALNDFTGLTVLDAATGSIRWNGLEWRNIRGGGILLDEHSRAARVDLATGRVELDFGRGSPVGDLILYPQPDRTTVLGQDDGRVIGTVLRVSPDACSATGDLLACQTYDAKIRVWRVTP